jgi:hypothetical protein
MGGDASCIPNIIERTAPAGAAEFGLTVVIPTISQPCSRSNAAAADESTPPLIATAII